MMIEVRYLVASSSTPPLSIRLLTTPISLASPFTRHVHPRTSADRFIEQLRIGAIEVKEALGTSISVSDTQIQEALWHYYFDVGKSVTYLKSMV
jgi:hypothetical protein